jgi:hydroxymethylbilane synthase
MTKAEAGGARLVRIGTRGSELALWQANWVKAQIELAHPGVTAELVRIKTSGDMILDVPLAQVGGKGLFVKELEEALLDHRVDLAVHSMKDVPVLFPPGLYLPVITAREDIRDAFVSADGTRLADLPRGAKIGTSSLRRKSQLLHWRPDFEIISIRGNVQTRLRKIRELSLAGTILAAAGLHRLGYADKITEYLPEELSLSAIGQGALGIEIRVGDERTLKLVAHLDDPRTHEGVGAERSLLRRLEGGCQVPIAARGVSDGTTVRLEGLVASTDGTRLVRRGASAPAADGERLGVSVAEELLSLGAREILSEVYGTKLE